MSTIAQEEQPKPSQINTIAKCAGYSAITLINGLLLYNVIPKAYESFEWDKGDLINVVLLAQIALFALYTTTKIYQEGKKALLNNNSKDINDETVI